jgi:ABC-type uncharacterized transport system permease subunit
MERALALLNGVLPLLYGGLVAIYALLLARDLPWTRRWGPRLLASVLVLHTGIVLAGSLYAGRNPVANRFELLSFAALAMTGAYLWVEWRRRNSYTGVFPLSLALLLQVCASLGRVDRYEVPEILRNPLFAWHSVSAAVAVAALSVGAVYGALFLVMYRLLKRGSFGAFTERMPSLDLLADMSLAAVEVGFVALTVAVGVGDVWVHRSPDLSMADPKVWATFVVWVVYGSAVAGRHLARWGGWRVVALNLTGYVLLLGSMTMIGRVFDTFHSFTGKP